MKKILVLFVIFSSSVVSAKQDPINVNSYKEHCPLSIPFVNVKDPSENVQLFFSNHVPSNEVNGWFVNDFKTSTLKLSHGMTADDDGHGPLLCIYRNSTGATTNELYLEKPVKSGYKCSIFGDMRNGKFLCAPIQ